LRAAVDLLAPVDVGGDVDVLSKDAIPFLQLFRAPIMVIAEDVRRAGMFLARAALAAGLDESGYGLIVSSSRGIFLADDPGAAAGALDSAIRSEADAVMAGR